jgi:hypothetical protein
MHCHGVSSDKPNLCASHSSLNCDIVSEIAKNVEPSRTIVELAADLAAAFASAVALLAVLLSSDDTFIVGAKEVIDQALGYEGLRCISGDP